MNEIVRILNLASTRIFEVLMAPVAGWPLIALIICSAISGILLAIVFRYTSNQQAIGRAADGSRAELLAINLFQDELVGVFRSLGRLFLHVFARVGHSLPPVVVVIIPLVLLLGQLASWYQWRPLTPGEPVVVELKIAREHWQQGQHAKIRDFDGTVEAGPMRDVGKLSVFWRLSPASANANVGADQIQFEVDGDVVEKHLVISSTGQHLTPVSPNRSVKWMEQLLYPIEPGLRPGGPVSEIAVNYPQRQTFIFGWDVPWWLTFLIVSMLAAFAVKPVVGVRF